MKLLKCLPLLALLHPMAAQAAPKPAAPKTIFACTTASGKHLQIERQGTTLHYAYGRPDAAPDLAFAVPAASARYTANAPDSGSWWISRSVTLAFNGVNYTAHWAFNRGDQSEEAGLTVKRGAKVLAETQCASDIDTALPD